MERQFEAVLLLGRLIERMAPGVEWNVGCEKESGEEVRFAPQAAHVGVTPDGRPIWQLPTDSAGRICPTITVADGEVTVEHHRSDYDDGWKTEQAWVTAFQHYGYCR